MQKEEGWLSPLLLLDRSTLLRTSPPRSNAIVFNPVRSVRKQELNAPLSARVRSKGIVICKLSSPTLSKSSTANLSLRPISRGYVQALEGQIASLEKFITKLIAVDGPQRDEMLANFGKSSGHFHPPSQDFNTSSASPGADPKAISIRSTTGHLRRVRDGKAAEFYGPTSFFQISPSDTLDHATSATENLSLDPSSSLGEQEIVIANSLEESSIYSDSQLAFSPQSHICRTLMASFFKNQYQYHMCLYREYFLRDFNTGKGPYYSDLLMYAICAMGALASEEIALRELSDVFFNRAQQLLYGSALESPNLTTLQALILLGHREIGHGKMSKGWLFSGMAFRLAHEMGLHLDPSNWKGSDDSRVEREIRKVNIPWKICPQ